MREVVDQELGWGGGALRFTLGWRSVGVLLEGSRRPSPLSRVYLSWTVLT